MAVYAFAVPILPGMEERNKRFADELMGARKAEYLASRGQIGAKVERVWHQQMPDGGTISIVYLEADDLGMSFGTLATSQDPFDVWWRQQILEVHGLDLSQPMAGPMNEQVFEFARE
jgi:hypothetical protein